MSRRRSSRHKKPSQDLDDPPASIPTLPQNGIPPLQTTPPAEKVKHTSPPQSPLSPISPWPPIDSVSPPDQASSSRPEPPPEDIVPTAKEVYGFVAVILTVLGYGTYLAWAFSPPHWLDAIGWTWYPDRQWAIVIPCYLMVLVLLTYLAYGGLTAYMTPSFDSPILITDPYSNIPHRDPTASTSDNVYSRLVRGETTEAVDIPIDMVNRTLYSARNSGDG